MVIKLRVEYLGVGTKSRIDEPRDEINFLLEGPEGDRHAGFTKKADGRDAGVKRGTIIRNWRQWSAVSTAELSRIAEGLGIDHVAPAWLGANIEFSGCDTLTQIPKGSMIWFASGLVLTVEGENAPCIGPGKEIAKHYPQVKPAHFPKVAHHLRGLVGVVYRPGFVRLGDTGLISTYEPFDALPAPPATIV